MLVGSGVRLGGGPFRSLGAPLANVTDRANWSTPGALLNLHAGEATVIEGASISDRNGYPSGLRHPASWSMGIKPGAMTTRKNAVGTSSMSVALAGGRNGEVVFAGSSSATAAGELVVSGAVSFVGSSSLTANSRRRSTAR